MSSDELFLEELLAALREVKLEAIIIGNTACILQGAPVLTQDVDLLVRNTPANLRKLERLAERLGAARPTELSELTFAKRILGAAVPIDVLLGKMAGGLRFETVRSRSVRISTGREVATVAALADVIRSKRAAGRRKDLAVLPLLEDTLKVTTALGAKPRVRR